MKTRIKFLVNLCQSAKSQVLVLNTVQCDCQISNKTCHLCRHHPGVEPTSAGETWTADDTIGV